MPSPSVRPRPPRPLRVHTVLDDGVEEQDFADHIEVFGIIGEEHDAQSFVTADGTRRVTTSSGMEVVCRDVWSPRFADVIVVPGGGYGEGAPASSGRSARHPAPGTRGRPAGRPRPGRGVHGHHAAVRHRPDGRTPLHHPPHRPGGASGPEPSRGRGRIVCDGDLVTCGEVTSGIDLGIWQIERFLGPDTALFAEEVLEYQRRGTVNTA